MLSKLSKKIRMWQWMVIAAVGIGVIYIVAPQQLGILLLKATYITIAIAIGYYADRVIFYYARPHKMREDAWVQTSTHTFKSERCEAAYRAYSAAMIRRAIIVSAVVIAFALGL
ncbi:MAG: hypothetical protein CSA44_00090 [Gammaproteobacteria bacterium]|nr:MAG: hypothetical protein CSA44_00090 [Gammaproteobacteria bacterium]